MKKIIIVFPLFFIISILAYTWSSAFVLYTIAGAIDVPSKTYYVVLERIFAISSKNKALGVSEHDHIMNMQIHTVGIVGSKSVDLLNLYTIYQHDKNNIGRVYQIIDSMGMVGDDNYVFLLETLLEDYEKLDVQVPKYSIARSLYLITGKTYSYRGSENDTMSGIPITDGLYRARQIIIKTKHRKRSLKEMVELDKVFRPPGW